MGALDATSADLSPVDEEGDVATLADAAAVVGELHPDLMAACRQLGPF
jgi:hypothetical protein